MLCMQLKQGQGTLQQNCAAFCKQLLKHLCGCSCYPSGVSAYVWHNLLVLEVLIDVLWLADIAMMVLLAIMLDIQQQHQVACSTSACRALAAATNKCVWVQLLLV